MASRTIAIFSLGLLACARNPSSPPVVRVAAPPAAQESAAAPTQLQSSVVAVLSEGQGYDFTSPWAKQRPWSRRMTGLVVEGNRILVAGVGLANNTLIEVQKRGEAQRYPAKVAIIDYEVALTLLEVGDPKFFEDLTALPIAAEVPASGSVSIARWLGSGQLETVDGSIRQVTVQDHYPGRTSLLSLDVSTSIDSSGSSDVVVADDEVIGLATNKIESQLKVMASPVLRQFLARAAERPYRGFARHGFSWQALTNPALRRQLGIPADRSLDEVGVLVRKVQPHGSAAGVIMPGDVVVKLGGHSINEVGKFEHPSYGKLSFALLFSDEHAPGDRLPATVLREGKEVEVSLLLRRMAPEADVVPPYVFDQAPEHLVIGGLVFQSLTRSYLETWRDWWKSAPLRLLVALDQHGAWPTPERQRIVVLSRVLPDPVNLGYQDLEPMIVTRINGRPATDLAAVAAAFNAPQGEFQVIEALPGQSTTRIVLDAKAVAEADPRIRALYGITGRSRP